MRRALRAAVGGGAFFVLVAVVCFVVAIWTVGPNSGRIAGTGAVVGISGLVVIFFASMALEMGRFR